MWYSRRLCRPGAAGALKWRLARGTGGARPHGGPIGCRLDAGVSQNCLSERGGCERCLNREWGTASGSGPCRTLVSVSFVRIEAPRRRSCDVSKLSKARTRCLVWRAECWAERRAEAAVAVGELLGTAWGVLGLPRVGALILAAVLLGAALITQAGPSQWGASLPTGFRGRWCFGGLTNPTVPVRTRRADLRRPERRDQGLSTDRLNPVTFADVSRGRRLLDRGLLGLALDPTSCKSLRLRALRV